MQDETYQSEKKNNNYNNKREYIVRFSMLKFIDNI